MLENHELSLVGVSPTGTLEFRTVYEKYGIRISAFRFAIYQIAQSRLSERSPRRKIREHHGHVKVSGQLGELFQDPRFVVHVIDDRGEPIDHHELQS